MTWWRRWTSGIHRTGPTTGIGSAWWSAIPAMPVRTVLFVVDCVPETVAEARASAPT